MQTTVTALARAFKAPKAPVSEVPALVRAETWQDVGLLTIGPKSYGFRCHPGNPAAGCTRVVRLFTDDGFAGDGYDVTFRAGRPPLCTCPDFTCRRKAETGASCKHIRAAVALGLDQAPSADGPEWAPAGTDEDPARAEEMPF